VPAPLLLPVVGVPWRPGDLGVPKNILVRGVGKVVGVDRREPQTVPRMETEETFFFFTRQDWRLVV